MTKRPAPVFLARRSYRQRRMADAARLLPFVGVFLLLLPILWQPRATAAPDTVRGVVYLFGIWTLLILAARFLAPRVMAAPAEDEEEDGHGDGPA